MNTAFDLDHVDGVRGRIRLHEPMARHSTWRCGGPAAVYFEPADCDDLVRFMQRGPSPQDYLWLGLGSNLLVRDGGVAHTVIATLSGFTRTEWISNDLVYVDCGVTCARIAREAAAKDRAGLEFLAGIPGTLGGALRMNAGALGSEIWTFVDAVTTIDNQGVVRRREANEFAPDYRTISGPECWFIGAWLRVTESANGRGSMRIREVLNQRNATQPTGKASCGSVFKNPVGDYAGRLIEQCGLKGCRVGDAEVSTVHANFIINSGHASATDIESLIARVHAEVRDQTGVDLHCEVQIVGQQSAPSPTASEA